MLPKFRIWDKEEKHMKTFPSSVGHLVGAILTEQMRGESNSVVKPNYSKYVVMMGTGLKDKNEKEIFEGDIVKQTVSGKIVVVSYDYDWGGFVPFIGCYQGYKVYEVLGNIYENPELLKEVK